MRSLFKLYGYEACLFQRVACPHISQFSTSTRLSVEYEDNATAPIREQTNRRKKRIQQSDLVAVRRAPTQDFDSYLDEILDSGFESFFDTYSPDTILQNRPTQDEPPATQTNTQDTNEILHRKSHEHISDADVLFVDTQNCSFDTAVYALARAQIMGVTDANIKNFKNIQTFLNANLAKLNAKQCVKILQCLAYSNSVKADLISHELTGNLLKHIARNVKLYQYDYIARIMYAYRRGNFRRQRFWDFMVAESQQKTYQIQMFILSLLANISLCIHIYT